MTHEQYMARCITLARKGAGAAAPNPMVGAVLVHSGRIIGEGWHRAHGGPHAEVNCIADVLPTDQHLIGQSTLYVSLEPCTHYGKTPPCADLIVKHKIPKVVVGCVDTFSEVAGKGIERMQAAGMEVTVGILEHECRELNKRFFARQEKQRPYIILKWAESADGFIAPPQGKRVMLSNDFSQLWVQKMRSEEGAILVGYRTALLDNPSLTNRYGSGPQPARIVIDPLLNLPANLRIFDQTNKTIVVNNMREGTEGNITWLKLNDTENMPNAICRHITNINSIIVEGGSQTLQSFIAADLWDEAFVISTPVLLGNGVAKPILTNAHRVSSWPIGIDTVRHFTKCKT
ncbi:MAG: bifunctional diaminohydroxyphosphoribosylaminopyrimidine deaminase/5-amino-6-(5-phosphoribosylamino)uracil reductase RibD [Edaphocola sp.]